MHRSLIPSTAALFTMLFARTPYATDLLIAPRVFSGVTYFEYEQEAGFFPSAGQTFSDFKVSGFLPLVGGALGVEYYPLYIAIQGQKTIRGQDSDDLTIISPFAAQRVNLDSEFERAELNVTAGYNVTKNFSVFGGYKYAKVDVANDVTGGPDVPGFPSLGFPVEGKLDVDFMYHGPFAGISYILPIDSLKAKLSFASAFTYYLADLNQQFKPSGGIPLPRASGDSGGNTVGYSFSISWAGKVTDHLRYTFDAYASKSDFEANGGAADFSETEYRFRAALEYPINTSSLFGLGQ